MLLRKYLLYIENYTIWCLFRTFIFVFFEIYLCNYTWNASTEYSFIATLKVSIEQHDLSKNYIYNTVLVSALIDSLCLEIGRVQWTRDLRWPYLRGMWLVARLQVDMLWHKICSCEYAQNRRMLLHHDNCMNWPSEFNIPVKLREKILFPYMWIA